MTLGSLFAGIGGFEEGAKKQGIETVWSVEIEKHNQQTLKRYFPQTNVYGDIRQALIEYQLQKVDIISGGFPCQDISQANGKKSKHTGINGERSGLWKEQARLCGILRPRYIIIENSPMLVHRGLETVLCDIAQIGYNAEWQCLCNSQFGYSHKRERVYIIAYTGQKRFKGKNEKRTIFKKIPQQTSPRKDSLLGIPKRFYGYKDYESLCVDDGFWDEIDTRTIEGYGNAVNVDVAAYLFECIKEFDQ